MDRSSKQKVNWATMALNDILDEMDITDLFTEFHPKAAEYTFFLSAHGTLSSINHLLGNKSGLTSTKRLRSYHTYFKNTTL